jgi:hypothetical protein
VRARNTRNRLLAIHGVVRRVGSSVRDHAHDRHPALELDPEQR